MTCETAIGFPNAPQMEQIATNLPIVWKEICMIQQAILAAASTCQPGGGKMCTTVAGDTPMTFVSGVLSVTVVNGGSGYLIDTPTISFIPPVGAIPSAVASANVVTNGGNILSVSMVSGGAGYQPVSPSINVSTITGTLANIHPLVNAAGNIVGVNIVNGGTGYTVTDSVVASRAILPNASYTDAVFAITSVSVTGQIISIAVLNAGSGYQDSVTTVRIMSTLNPLMPYQLGTGFIGTVMTDSLGVVTGVQVFNTGAGYASFPPYLVISDPGTGATTSVTLGAGIASSSVAAINIITPGVHYTPSATGTVLNPPTAPVPNPPLLPAVIALNMANNTFGTDPHMYWQVWSNAVTDKPTQMQLNAVLSYFARLGYTIVIQSNPLTGSTIQWRVCW